MTIAGWTSVRIVMLWPEVAPALQASAATRTASRQPTILLRADPASSPALFTSGAQQAAAAYVLAHASARPGLPGRPAAGAAVNPAMVALALASMLRFDEAQHAEESQQGSIPPPLRPAPFAAAPARLAGSAWLLTRGGGRGALIGGELGGSQAGLRLTYALGSARRVALAARVATPLNGRGREAAVGIEWQPTPAPIRLVAEQRFALDGGKGGPTVMAIGGIGPKPISAGFRLESYAQAGAIARDGIEAFADGAARLTHPLTTVAGATLDVGGGTWGAAQRRAARLDIGPTLGLAIPAGRRSLRLTLDYRERIAGDARPGSGVALSIGSDF